MVELSKILGRPDLVSDPAATRTVLASIPFRDMSELLENIEWLRSHPQVPVGEITLDIVDAVGRSAGVVQLEQVERGAKLASDLENAPAIVDRRYLLCVRAAPPK